MDGRAGGGHGDKGRGDQARTGGKSEAEGHWRSRASRNEAVKKERGSERVETLVLSLSSRKETAVMEGIESAF